ncbi:ABC transporter permease [Lentzea fradiae]|uniref:ABC transporter permease n=1 Tax=Lentzea fradiae TaxID=200378 RepID=UPI00115F966C|nr:FtsX-like permease family protein [Lentzea fradiae]
MFADLALGVRLAVGGSRKSWVRLLLQGVGIGLCVAVLLLAASVPTAFGNRQQREEAAGPVTTESADAPLLVENGSVAFRDDNVRGMYVRVLAPGAPKPPGVERLPADGEILVSPALAELLASREGELLRPRFPQKVVGTIGDEGLESPSQLRFLAGDGKIEPAEDNRVSGFGNAEYGEGLPEVMLLLSIVSAVVLLFPVLVFVSVSARLAAAQRDRRLAALRLVGAGATRVRLIASGEALAGAVVGLVIGFGLLHAVRPFVGDIPISQLALFPADVVPTLPLTLVVVVAVPALAVLTSVFAMRRLIIEPLGVVREQKPVRRRLWWRVVPALGGAALLASQAGLFGSGSKPNDAVVVGGVVLLLFAIPALLPWLVERVVSGTRGATPALQLAVRRLQLDAGTAARVVGGVAVVLAGVVTLQMIFATAEREVRGDRAASADVKHLTVDVSGNADLPQLPGVLAGVKGVVDVQELTSTYAVGPERQHFAVKIGSCDALRLSTGIGSCADGDVFVVPPASAEWGTVQTGDTIALGKARVPWTAPEVKQAAGNDTGLYITSAAVAGIGLTGELKEVQAEVDLAVPDVVEHARNAIAPYGWRVHTYFGGEDISDRVEESFSLVRNALYGAALVTLLLAAASLLVVGLEQVRERRRPLAAMAASGIPRSTLAWSLVWQNAIPLVLSTVVSVATGVVLGALVARVLDGEVVFDWAGTGLVTAVSVGMVALVTVATLPSLRRATGALGLRTE